jgi:hypothetical protein
VTASLDHMKRMLAHLKGDEAKIDVVEAILIEASAFQNERGAYDPDDIRELAKSIVAALT